MRRLLVVVGALVIFPIIEIAVLIAVGKVIGIGWTLLLMLGTSALGGWLLKHEGMRAWRVFQADLNEGRPPGNAATEGLLLLVGGVFMLVPGFVSDVIGLLLIAPPTRRLARIGLLHTLTGQMSPVTATTLFGPRRVRARSGPARYGADRGEADREAPPTVVNGGAPIEGEIIDLRHPPH